MKSFRILLVCGLVFWSVTCAWSQSPGTINPLPHPCGTMEQDSINRLRFPGRSTFDDFEKAIQQRAAEIAARNKNGRMQGTVVTIPIIVHVVHNGEPVGTGMNISQAQIQSEIAVLNEDYRRKAGTPGFNTNPV